MAPSIRPLEVGERVGSYEILGTAGIGGVGIVYKALDQKLNRTVALKFLPHDLNLDPKDKERFLQEARTASGLDHANIGVIHGLEETADGRTFIVMAYYEGLTLQEKIRRGPMSHKEALDVIAQVAKGLAEAHDHSIIHRDIKPSNVILTRQGVAKIVDFGLARVASSAATTARTAGPVGTLAYMSPEQVRNEPLDRRTDIWSMGVTFEEMLTGKHPFERENMSAVLMAILEQPPPVEGLDPSLAGIVCRALAKDRTHRYGDCREFLADVEACKPAFELAAPASSPSKGSRTSSSRELKRALEHASSTRAVITTMARARRWLMEGIAALVLLVVIALLIPPVRQRAADLLAGRSLEGEKHIAVLPFNNIGNDSTNEAISEGLMDSLTSKLSNLEGGKQSLWVVPASEVRRKKVSDPESALREFGATLVVEGSVMRDPSGVHLTVNLIRTKDVRQEGSLSLQDPAGDFAALQNQAVTGLARLMHVEIPAGAMTGAEATAAPAAYESYLKALGYMQRYDKAGNLDQAIEALSGAVRDDSQFALGYAALGEAYRLKYQLDKNPKWTDLALTSATKAATLNPSLPSAYVTLGSVHRDTGKTDLALGEFQRALQLDPRNADAMHGLAHSYEAAGRLADAEAEFKKAVALRPEYWDGYNTLGIFYDVHERYDESVAQYQRALELTPDNAQVYSNLGAVYLDSGDPKKIPLAEAALKKSIELSPGYPAYANLGYMYLSQRRFAEAAAACEKALQLNDRDFLTWANLSSAYQGLNEKQKASAAENRELPLLETAVTRSPREAGAQGRLALLYAKKKMRDKALDRVQTALALAPDDTDVLENVAETYDALGDHKRALEYLKESLRKGASVNVLENDPLLKDLMADPEMGQAIKNSKK